MGPEAGFDGVVVGASVGGMFTTVGVGALEEGGLVDWTGAGVAGMGEGLATDWVAWGFVSGLVGCPPKRGTGVGVVIGVGVLVGVGVGVGEEPHPASITATSATRKMMGKRKVRCRDIAYMVESSVGLRNARA